MNPSISSTLKDGGNIQTVVTNGNTNTIFLHHRVCWLHNLPLSCKSRNVWGFDEAALSCRHVTDGQWLMWSGHEGPRDVGRERARAPRQGKWRFGATAGFQMILTWNDALKPLDLAGHAGDCCTLVDKVKEVLVRASLEKRNGKKIDCLIETFTYCLP